MGERVEDLQHALCELASRLERVERRVETLEAGTVAVRSAEAAPDGVEAVVPPALPRGALALAGRTLLVLAGAYVVRALAEGQLLRPELAAGVGIAYAALWQRQADHDARLGRPASAAFHDLASSLIAFPLIFEAAVRFRMLPAAAACAAIACFYALGLAVAWRRRLVANAVVTVVLGTASCLALLVATHDLLPALLALLAMAAGVEWLAFRRRWLPLRWPAAAALDLVALLTVAVSSRPHLPEGYAPLSPAAAASALVALAALYVASVAARTVRLGLPVTMFEMIQGSAAVALGTFGAARVLSAHGLSVAAPGMFALLLGVLCYVAALAEGERSATSQRNRHFFSSAGLLLTLGGAGLVGLLGSPAPVWLGAAVAAAFLGRRRLGRTTLRVHAALYVVAASLHSGLLPSCVRSISAHADAALTPLAWLSALVAVAVWVALGPVDDPGRTGAACVPRLLLASVLALVLARALQVGAWSLLGAVVATDPGLASVARTAVLAAMALLLAAGARWRSLPELAWLVYPVLLAGGLKLLLQDFRHGRPVTLVASLALYGVVLTLAPRILGRPARA